MDQANSEEGHHLDDSCPKASKDVVTHEDLLRKCREIHDKITTLHAELQLLKQALEQQAAFSFKPLPWNQAVAGLGNFERLVASEKNHVESMLTLGESKDDGDRDRFDAVNGELAHKINACNYKFHDIVWETAKKGYHLVGLRRDFQWSRKTRKGNAVIVDVVLDGGAEWLKIITTTKRRLLFEMTDAGWDWDRDSDSDSNSDAGVDADEDSGFGSDEGNGESPACRRHRSERRSRRHPPPILQDAAEHDIELLRVTRQLVEASSINCHNYRRPSIRVVLSRISEGEDPHVDRILRHVRTFGQDQPDLNLTVETLSTRGGLLDQPTPPVDVAISNLVDQDPFRGFTGVLNVDCSVFIALASDFSHTVIKPDSTLLRSNQHRQDAEDEMNNGPRLLTTVYPAIGPRDLVCTQDAADTFLKIVYDIGTDTEQARARLLFEDREPRQPSPPGQTITIQEEATELDRIQRLEKLAALSTYPVPQDLKLPIKTVDPITWDDAQRLVENRELPEVALAVGSKGSGLNAMNVSSFLHGWRANLTTITSNWEAAKRLKTVIETNRKSGSEVGPHIWRIPFSRKLLAKPRVEGMDRAPVKTRKERRQEKTSSLQRGVPVDDGSDVVVVVVGGGGADSCIGEGEGEGTEGGGGEGCRKGRRSDE